MTRLIHHIQDHPQPWAWGFLILMAFLGGGRL